MSSKFKIDFDSYVLNFHHIQKCGGITLRDILVPQFKPQERFIMKRSRFYGDYLNQLSHMSPEERRKIKFITGHQYYELHEYFDRSMIRLIMFRDPYMRVISQYLYYRAHSDMEHHENALKYSLRDFLENGFDPIMDNGMVRSLLSRAEQPPYGNVTQDHLQRATNNLITGTFLVGIVEQFDRSIIYFWDEIGGRYPIYSRANSRKTKMPFFQKSDYDAIRKFNSLDTQIYARACAILRNNFSLPDHRVNNFVTLNRMFGWLRIGPRSGRAIQRFLKRTDDK